MKKILFASTALVAFGLVGAAQAADPISLKLGGYSKWVVGYASNDDNFDAGTTGNINGLAAAGPAGVQETLNWDVKGTNEVYFTGATTLDNGLKISVQMELEAGGTGDTTADTIDEAYITVDSAFGRVILGSENNGAYLLHVAAPDAAANFGESEIGIVRGIWVRNPRRDALIATGAGVGAPFIGGNGTLASTGWTTAINTDNDSKKITYVAPSFAGFTVGGSFIPQIQVNNPNGDQDQMPIDEFGLDNTWGLAAAYNNSFAGVGVKLSAGYVSVGDTNGAATGLDDHDEFSFGAQFSYAGFTLGGGYKNISSDLTAAAGGGDSFLDGRVFEAGLQYATGPFAVSFAYLNAEQETVGAGVGDDSWEVYQFSGKYNMGPGVDMIATIGHADGELAGGRAVNGAVGANDGWAAMTGLALAF